MCPIKLDGKGRRIRTASAPNDVRHEPAEVVSDGILVLTDAQSARRITDDPASKYGVAFPRGRQIGRRRLPVDRRDRRQLGDNGLGSR